MSTGQISRFSGKLGLVLVTAPVRTMEGAATGYMLGSERRVLVVNGGPFLKQNIVVRFKMRQYNLEGTFCGFVSGSSEFDPKYFDLESEQYAFHASWDSEMSSSGHDPTNMGPTYDEARNWYGPTDFAGFVYASEQVHVITDYRESRVIQSGELVKTLQTTFAELPKSSHLLLHDSTINTETAREIIKQAGFFPVKLEPYRRH